MQFASHWWPADMVHFGAVRWSVCSGPHSEILLEAEMEANESFRKCHFILEGKKIVELIQSEIPTFSVYCELSYRWLQNQSLWSARETIKLPLEQSSAKLSWKLYTPKDSRFQRLNQKWQPKRSSRRWLLQLIFIWGLLISQVSHLLAGKSKTKSLLATSKCVASALLRETEKQRENFQLGLGQVQTLAMRVATTGKSFVGGEWKAPVRSLHLPHKPFKLI